MSPPNRTSARHIRRCHNCGAVMSERELRVNPTGYCDRCDSLQRLLDGIDSENGGTRTDRIEYIANAAAAALHAAAHGAAQA